MMREAFGQRGGGRGDAAGGRGDVGESVDGDGFSQIRMWVGEIFGARWFGRVVWWGYVEGGLWEKVFFEPQGLGLMPQSLSQLYAHLIFSTKDRFPFLTDDIRERVHGYLATTLRDMGSRFVVVGGVADHVHILFDMGRNHPARDFVEQIKRESSKFIKTLRPNLDHFYWQRGYGIFSVSPTHKESVVAYIQSQAEHHRVKSFQEEYREFLNRYGIEFDERYVWE